MSPTIHLVTSENLDIFQKSIWSNVSRVTPLCGVVKDSKSVNYLPTNQARGKITYWAVVENSKILIFPHCIFQFCSSNILYLACYRRDVGNKPSATWQSAPTVNWPFHIAKHFINHICSHNSSKIILLLWMWAESKSHCKTFYQSDLQSHFPLKPYCCSECEQNQNPKIWYFRCRCLKQAVGVCKYPSSKVFCSQQYLQILLSAFNNQTD